MSLAPTQTDPTTCGTQVKGLLMNTVANSTGRFSRNSTPSMTQVTRCTGRGVGGIKAINRPSANARVTLCRLKRPVSAVEHQRLERPQTPEFLQRMAVRCNAFQPALHG